MNTKHLSYAFLGLMVGVIMSTSVQFIVAWNPPTDAPPNNNTRGPITEGPGSVFQTRDSGLGLSGNVQVINVGAQDNKVTAPKICINNDGTDTNCIADWSDVTGGSTVAPGAYAGSFVVQNNNGACHVANKFTGNCSCYSGFSAKYMMTIENSRSYNMYECWSN